MSHRIITIEREYASGGREIGEMIAERLGIPCYNREILQMASERCNVSMEYLETAEEAAPKSFLYTLMLTSSPTRTIEENLPLSDKVYIIETNIIRELAEKGDCVFIISDKTSKALPILGALRLMVAKELDIIPKGKWNFLRITEMPFFEQDEETGEWIAMHHPFTMPMEECLPYLDTDKARVRAKAFDLVLNGIELSSGSLRITDCQLLNKMFDLLGLSKEEIDAKFGFLVEAYQYAAPPHGGMGIGLDRLAMLICGADSLRDVTAFPKVQNASELMSGCPAGIDAVQLEELGMPLPEADA